MSRFSAPATGTQPGNACGRADILMEDVQQPTDEFFQRTEDYVQLKDRVKELTLPPIQAGEKFILVHGNAGMGKTSLVKALCHDSDVLDNWEYDAHFIEIGAGAGIDSQDAAARQAEARRIGRKANDIRLATQAKSSRKLIVLDDMQPDQANDLFRTFGSSRRKLTVVIITSRNDPDAWSHERFQYSIDIRPDSVACLAMLAKYAYEGSTKCHLDDEHQGVGEAIVKDVREPHQLCLIGCALNSELSGVSWSNILSDQGTGAANMEDILDAAPDLPYRSSANALNIQDTLRIHLSVTKLQVPKGQKREWDVLLRVLGLFNWDEPLPLVALQIVWRAYVVHKGGGGCLSGFEQHLQALVNARVLEPFPGDASLFRLGVGVLEHDVLSKLFIFRSIVDVHLNTKDTEANLLVQAFICLCYYGSDKEAALAELQQLPGAQPQPADGSPWPSHFEARKLYEINVPAVLEELLRPPSHEGPESLVQQLLVSAATGSVLCDVKRWLPELLRNIRTAPLALAVVVGALKEEQGRWVHRICWHAEHEQAIDRCCQNCLDNTGDQFDACAAADYLRQVWKVVFLELGDYDLAHRVIENVVTLYSRRGDNLRQLQARRWMAATCAWKGDREEGRKILKENAILVDSELKNLCGQCAELQQPWRNECWRTWLAISEMLVGTRSHNEAREKAGDALRLAEEAFRQCEQLSGCATTLTVQARRMKAWSWRHQGEYDKALCEFEELLKDRRGMQHDQQRDEEHYLTLLSQAELGVAYGDKERHSCALNQKQYALDRLRPILGDDHPLCLKLQRSIAVTLVLLDLHDEALKSDKELRVKFISRRMLVDQLQSIHDAAVDQYRRSLQWQDLGVPVMPNGNPIKHALQEALQAALEAQRMVAVIERGNMRVERPWQSDMVQDIKVIRDLLCEDSGKQEQQKTSQGVMSCAANSQDASNVVRAILNAGEGFDVGIGSWEPRKPDLCRSVASSPVANFCLNKRELPLFPLVADE